MNENDSFQFSCKFCVNRVNNFKIRKKSLKCYTRTILTQKKLKINLC